MPGAPLWKSHSERLLVAVFLVLVGSFVLTTMLVQRASSDVETLSHTLADTSMPRIEQVAALRAATYEARQALGETIQSDPGERAARVRELDRKLVEVKREARRNAQQRAVLGEHGLAGELDDALDAYIDEVARTRAVIDTLPELAHAMYERRVLPASNALGEAAMREIDFHARYGSGLARSIREARANAVALSYVLTGACILLAVTGILLVRRQRRQRLVLLERYVHEHESKAAEMEQFAGRVAHDIRNPVASASLAAELLAGPELDPDARRRTVDRLHRSLARTNSIIDGLLAFARAGARPEPGARANLREVVDDIAEAIAPELRAAGIELATDVPPVLVRCSTGVLASLVGNLVRNAVKYMDDRDPRRIAIRTVERDGLIRVEVSDTGPGIVPELLPRLFEPYFRAATRGQAGIGLGLPTVRKLAEGHGGSAGGRSRPGEGSTFWFELPGAGTAWQADDELDRQALDGSPTTTH
jgi:signal transduction histidine kinase